MSTEYLTKETDFFQDSSSTITILPCEDNEHILGDEDYDPVTQVLWVTCERCGAVFCEID